MNINKGHILGGALIIAGTSIGAGALAIPVSTSLGGFFPAFIFYVFTWLFMTSTGLLFLEIALKMPKDANLISMSQKYLGFWGKLVTWVVYLFMFYSLLTAYISGGGDLFIHWTGDSLERHLAYILFLMIFMPVVYLGTKMVEKVNATLMITLIFTYLLFVVMSVNKIQFHYLGHMNWKQAAFALPVIFTSLGYQSVVPTLVSYLKKDARKLRYAIILGTSITFVIYLIWELLILGIVPLYGENGLALAKEIGLSAIQPLSFHIESQTIVTISNIFGFCAIATSFMGVSLGLFDFLADGFSIEKKGSKKVLIAILTFLPPVIVALTNPGLFLIAFQYAGGIGTTILLGLIPTLMVWVARFVKKDQIRMQLPGGKSVLTLLVLFVVFVLTVQFVNEYFRLTSS